MTIAVVDFLHPVDVDVDNAQRTQGLVRKSVQHFYVAVPVLQAGE